MKRMKTTRLRNSHFGPYLHVPHLNGAGSIVLATSRYGLKPFGIRLPHQVYLTYALSVMRRESATELWALPVGVEGAWVQLVGPEPGATFPEALSFATAHAETHTCPSRRASGERCTTFCTDCGGRGWVA